MVIAFNFLIFLLPLASGSLLANDGDRIIDLIRVIGKIGNDETKTTLIESRGMG